MTRTNGNMDDSLISAVVHPHPPDSERAAIDFALRRTSRDLLVAGEVLEMEGSGWDGALSEMRGAPPDISAAHSN
ncbi:MAG: hypothetical protein JST73_07995 [Actinobacteria bacterium]|nr:hypothetical protein [Actinomycetota bacterium]